MTSKPRKATPDLMDGLLSGKQSQVPAPAAAPAPAAPPQPADRAPAESIKATFYLGQDTVDALDEARLLLLKLLRPEHKHDVSKSVIVEQAIKLALEELRAQGAGSSLVKALG